MAEENRALEWDSEISKESEFELLPEGTYNFTVESIERGRFEGSEKMGPCPVANLTLRVSNPVDGRTGNVFDHLYLHSKAEWKLSQFFEAIGQKKKGEPLRMNWNEVPGSSGKLKLGICKYTSKSGESRENNQVTQYLLKETRKFTPGQF